MAKKSKRRSNPKRARARRGRASSPTRFVLKTEGLCKCATPKAATLATLARRMATVCKRDPHSYIVDSKAGTSDRVAMRCTDIRRRKLAAMPTGAQLPLFGRSR
jgi:hypothetical protein